MIGLADSGTIVSWVSDSGGSCRALVWLPLLALAPDTSLRTPSNPFPTRGMRIDSRVTLPDIKTGSPADACDITDLTSTAGAGAPIAKAGRRGGIGGAAAKPKPGRG